MKISGVYKGKIGYTPIVSNTKKGLRLIRFGLLNLSRGKLFEEINKNFETNPDNKYTNIIYEKFTVPSQLRTYILFHKEPSKFRQKGMKNFPKNSQHTQLHSNMS